MSLIEALATPAPKSAPSKMDAWIEQLPDSEHDAVIAAALNTEWSHKTLRAVLIKNGAPPVGETAFRRWRVLVGWSA